MIYTYLNEYEVQTFSNCPDEEINTLLQEVNKTRGRFLVQTRRIVKPRFLRGPKVTHMYTLYARTGTVSEVQIINFPPANAYPDLNTTVSKQLLITFLLAFMAGMEAK